MMSIKKKKRRKRKPKWRDTYKYVGYIKSLDKNLDAEFDKQLLMDKKHDKIAYLEGQYTDLTETEWITI